MLGAVFSFLVCLGSTPRQVSATVSVQRTGTVAALLEQVSKSSGVHLEAEKEKESEILIVSVENAPVTELMERIAWATFGKWEPVKGGFRLRGSRAEELKADDAYRGECIRLAKKTINEYCSAVLDPSKSDREVADATMPKEVTPYSHPNTPPGARLLARLLKLVNPRDLLITETDDWPVISSEPTPFEHSFAHNVDGFLRSYAVENKLFDKTGAPVHLTAMLTTTLGINGGYGQLVLYYPDGSKILLDRPMINFETGQTMSYHLPAAFEPLIPKDGKVGYSTETQEYFLPSSSKSQASNLSHEDLTLMKKVVQRVLDPVAFEPQGTFATDALRTLAKVSHRSIVANLDDGWDTFSPIRQREEIPLATVIGSMLYSAAGKVEPNWIDIRPFAPNLNGNHRINRVALRKFLNDPNKADSLEGLVSLGDFVSHCGFSTFSWQANNYLQNFRSGGFSSFDEERLGLAQLVAALPIQDRNDWFAGKTLFVRDMVPEVRSAALNWAISRYRHYDNNGIDNISDVYTRRAPRGILDDAILTNDISGEDGYWLKFHYPDDPSEFRLEWQPAKQAFWMLDADSAYMSHIEIQRGHRQIAKLQLKMSGLKTPVHCEAYRGKPDLKGFKPFAGATDIIEELKKIPDPTKAGHPSGARIPPQP